MNKNDKRRAEKGITLVALVITVIVLLILAGTAITIAINGGDIFTKATTARETWNAALEEEENALLPVVQQLDDY